MGEKPTVGGAALGQRAVSFEGLLEAAPDAMMGVDQGGVIRFVNRQTELFGYDRTDLVGQRIETLVPLGAISSPRVSEVGSRSLLF